MTKPRTKKPESPGGHLQAAILDAFELNAAEVLLLGQAAAIADELERVNVELAARPLITAGSTGQDVADPLRSVQRQHAETLARLLAAIALPVADEDEGRSVTSASASRAATIRWARQREKDAG